MVVLIQNKVYIRLLPYPFIIEIYLHLPIFFLSSLLQMQGKREYGHAELFALILSRFELKSYRHIYLWWKAF